MSRNFDKKNCHFCKKTIEKESKICFDCEVNIQNKTSNRILSLSLCLFFGRLDILGFFLFTPKVGFTLILISFLFFLINILIYKKQDFLLVLFFLNFILIKPLLLFFFVFHLFKFFFNLLKHTIYYFFSHIASISTTINNAKS